MDRRIKKPWDSQVWGKGRKSWRKGRARENDWKWAGWKKKAARDGRLPAPSPIKNFQNCALGKTKYTYFTESIGNERDLKEIREDC